MSGRLLFQQIQPEEAERAFTELESLLGRLHKASFNAEIRRMIGKTEEEVAAGNRDAAIHNGSLWSWQAEEVVPQLMDYYLTRSFAKNLAALNPRTDSTRSLIVPHSLLAGIVPDADVDTAQSNNKRSQRTRKKMRDPFVKLSTSYKDTFAAEMVAKLSARRVEVLSTPSANLHNISPIPYPDNGTQLDRAADLLIRLAKASTRPGTRLATASRSCFDQWTDSISAPYAKFKGSPQKLQSAEMPVLVEARLGGATFRQIESATRSMEDYDQMVDVSVPLHERFKHLLSEEQHHDINVILARPAFSFDKSDREAFKSYLDQHAADPSWKQSLNIYPFLHSRLSGQPQRSHAESTEGESLWLRIVEDPNFEKSYKVLLTWPGEEPTPPTSA